MSTESRQVLQQDTLFRANKQQYEFLPEPFASTSSFHPCLSKQCFASCRRKLRPGLLLALRNGLPLRHVREISRKVVSGYKLSIGFPQSTGRYALFNEAKLPQADSPLVFSRPAPYCRGKLPAKYFGRESLSRQSIPLAADLSRLSQSRPL